MQRTLLAIILIVVLLAIANTFMAPDDGAKADPEKVAAKVTIGKETTFITEPLRADGFPDYVAALNNAMSAGVTPENNAAVLFLEAIGPKEIRKSRRAEFFRLLGIAPLEENGKYFVPQSELIVAWQAGELEGMPEAPEDAYSAIEPVTLRPWTAKEYPIVAEWLKRNAKPLEKIIAATRRPKYYWPRAVVDNAGASLMQSLGEQFLSQREVVEALIAQAMLKVQERGSEAAWQNLLAAHRLARLTATHAYLVGGIASFACDQQATRADAVFLHATNPNAEQLAKLQKEFEALATFPELISLVDFSERCFVLDSICFDARTGPEKLAADRAAILKMSIRMMPGAREAMAAFVEIVTSAPVNWDVPLATMNRWIDGAVAACRLPIRAERVAAIDRLVQEAKQLGAQAAVSDERYKEAFKVDPSAAASQRLAGIYLAQSLLGFQYIADVQDRADVYKELRKTIFALAAYRADYQKYPEKLDELSPKYLAAVPNDIFQSTPTPLQYRREADAYVLWSVGNDGKNDNGKSHADEPSGDDITLRPVVPKPNAK